MAIDTAKQVQTYVISHMKAWAQINSGARPCFPFYSPSAHTYEIPFLFLGPLSGKGTQAARLCDANEPPLHW